MVRTRTQVNDTFGCKAMQPNQVIFSYKVRYVLLSLCCASVLFACTTRQHSSKTVQYEVLLAPQVQSEYLPSQYVRFALGDCKRVSRSENRWQFTYTERNGGQRKLQRAFEADSLVRSIVVVDSLIQPPTNSTNQGFHKSNPIKNQ